MLSLLQLDLTEQRLTQDGKNDVICKVELKLGRPLQWFTYLHFNELQFRHLSESVLDDLHDPLVSQGKLARN